MKLSEWVVKNGGTAVEVPAGIFSPFIVQPDDIVPGRTMLTPSNAEICEKCLTNYPSGFVHECSADTQEAQHD